jgi:hypothetical protein
MDWTIGAENKRRPGPMAMFFSAIASREELRLEFAD